MGKVKTLEFIVDGKAYNVNVNVTSKGFFTIEMPMALFDPLNIAREFRGKQESKTFEGVTDYYLEKYREYKTANTTEDLFIGTTYEASGSFKADGDRDRFSGSYNSRPSLSFDYKLYMMRTLSTGAIQTFSVKKWDDPKTYGVIEKDGELFILDGVNYGTTGKMIPYSRKSVETLEKAKDGLKKISNILFDFTQLAESEMEALLVGGNLLGQRKEELGK